jgi:hypothetical protein
MSVRRSKYPTDDAGRALLWRHQKVIHALQRGQLESSGFTPFDALLLVVAPPGWLLNVSLEAVRAEVAA